MRLNAQPFQVLLLLLERPGELLTREEIARALWPEDTFVDYEHGVNSAVNRIREALGDSANGARFVETLARRGYRFVAPVELIAAAGETAPGTNGSSAAAAISPNPGTQDGAAGTAAAAASDGPEPLATSGILTTPQELPRVPWTVAQTLFVLFQVMYLGFYIGALANLAEIQDLLAPLRRAMPIEMILIVTGAALIPVRAFVLCAALFRAPRVREKMLALWPFLLPLDELWALAPFLLLHRINFGVALSCTALLAWAPFVQRSLILMGAGAGAAELSALRR